MKRGRVWAVLGPAEGFGPSIVKYLSARDQTMIQLTHTDPARFCDSVKTFTDRHGLIDILIDNMGYGLIDSLGRTSPTDLEAQIEKSLRDTLGVVQRVLPYMAPWPEGKIICMPPKPCILMDSGEPIYDERADAVEQYSNRLEKELPILVGKFTYLASKANARYDANNPGE